jgi:thiamine transport system substrate-binding protein
MRTARFFSFFLIILVTLHGASIAKANQKPTLTVYTYASFAGEYGPGSKIKAAFEAVCDCKLAFIGLDDTGALLARLKLEGESTAADVVLGLDSSQIADATPLMQPHRQAPEGLSLPDPWTDLHFMPFDFGHIALIYDSAKLKNPPKSFRELIDNEDGPTLIIQDPRTSAPGFGFLLWMKLAFGDASAEAWTKLKPRIVTYTKGWSEAYELFLKGEADMVVSYTTSPAYHIAVEKKDQYKAAIFPEGHVLQIEVMGLTKAARDPALAKRFIGFMLSEEAQGLIPEGNWMLPARLANEKWPASFKAIPLPERTLSMPPVRISAERRAMIDAWLAATTQ